MMFFAILYSLLKYQQRELFLSEVNNRETIAAIEAHNENVFSPKTNRKVPADVHLLHSFIHVFIYNSITKYY